MRRLSLSLPLLSITRRCCLPSLSPSAGIGRLVIQPIKAIVIAVGWLLLVSVGGADLPVAVASGAALPGGRLVGG